MPHRLYLSDLPRPAVGRLLAVGGDEARHAAVKRLAVGERIELRDGRGLCADAEVVAITPPRGKHEGVLSVRVLAERVEPEPSPAVEVWSATPKGDRAEQVVDQLSQLGVAVWRPLATARGVVDPGAAKIARLERVAVEACKQCGRAWLMTVGPGAGLAEALRADAGEHVLMADASGEPLRPVAPAGRCRVLIGPEGGWTGDELSAARSAGADIVRLGPHVLRTETAAVAAAALLLAGGPGAGKSA